MEFEELAALAYQEALLPPYAGLWEQAAYLGLRSLYRDYKNNLISKDGAASEKSKIEFAYLDAKAKEENERKLYQAVNAIRVKTAKIRPVLEQCGCQACKMMMDAIDGKEVVL